MSDDNARPNPDAPRFLAPKARRGDGWGYADIPQLGMREEPECLTENEWLAHVAKRAQDFEEQQRKFEEAKLEQARRLKTFEERLESATREARTAKRRIDVVNEVRLLRHMQQSGKEVRHLERRLYLLERKVWRQGDDQ